MWRCGTQSEDNEIVDMARELYAEDPAAMPVPAEHTRHTLTILRAESVRGRAVVLETNGAIAGYAFLMSFWSNELGGEVIVVDELYVRPSFRNQGYGRALLTEIMEGNRVWPRPAVAIELEVTPKNKRAAALYSAFGFKPIENTRMRLLRLGISAD